MYFDNFPTFLYPFKINNKVEYKLIKDISQNVRVRKEILANITLYDEYDIRDGDTPEIISEKVYGSPLYHWVVLYMSLRSMSHLSMAQDMSMTHIIMLIIKAS